MRTKVNRNILWTRIFVDQLAELGVQHACISPGSRSTPLTYILSRNRKIKSFVHFDERSSAFFALGLAKATGKPVMVVTTSGTAVAELYPAIIEAYQQRTPLIICTADRPAELIGTGANQTINQHNIFKNHIRWFRDLGLPSISEVGFHHLQKIAIRAFRICLFEDRGPVHLNFPFKKPLEPFSYTDKITKRILQIKPQKASSHISKSVYSGIERSIQFKKIASKILESERGLILAGPLEYDLKLIRKVKEFSSVLKYPIIADGISQFRLGSGKNDKSVISNFNSILSSDKFLEEHNPEIIIQFGKSPTSAYLESFLENTDASRYLINEFGDDHDPLRNANGIVKADPIETCELLISSLKEEGINRNISDWFNNLIKADEFSEKVKTGIIEKAKFPNEPSVIYEVIKALPSGSNLIIGNSLPVRDMDYFTSKALKKVIIHFNRGASGIDGVTSTALGIAAKKNAAVLITGDLSFLHDLNSLSSAINYSIPLTIIIINNNGGGIFESLPIANKVKHFDKFFIAPHNLELGDIARSFGINYYLINSKRSLQKQLKNSISKKITTVLEVQTDAGKSVELRTKIFNQVKKRLNKEFEK